jgi:lipid II:glycine glycyltransferase (peptidoglycan interpeptide bridge formation enzyme)
MLTVTSADANRRAVWDAFVAASPTGSFLQSWRWGEFQEAAGFSVRRVLIGEHPETPHAACLLIERPLPFGERSVYAPWGPVLAGGSHRWEETLRTLRTWAAEHLHPVYIRVEPKIPPTDHHRAALEDAGFVLLDRAVQPMNTRILDVRHSEDDLLRQMHSKTRYNIRVAIRHGVRVEDRSSPEGIRTFLALAREVEGRGQFRYHPASYYETMLRVLTAGDMFHLLVAVHNGVPLAAAIFTTFGGTFTYAHGASTSRKAHVMASHLLHWEAIRRARACGAKYYDFFGIAPARITTRSLGGGPAGDARHPWAGITRFKKGFGGTEEHYLGIADTVLDPVKYRVYTVARGLRSLLHR